MKAQKWILAKQFEGKCTDENIQLVEEELPELKENEVLLKSLYLSVDPYMRAFAATVGAPMMGEVVAQVIKTKNGKYPLGTTVLAMVGWRSHFISNGDDLEPISFDLGSTSKSYLLGVLGMPGATAYFGLYRLCEPKAGDIVLVNGAAGAVGSIVGQLAKIRGCTVIAFAGSDDKVAWCKNELGFDHVFNYKKIHFSEAISQVAPDGVDVFFDNVGGEFFHTVLNKHMKKNGRVCICGSIENYNDKDQKTYPPVNFSILSKQLTVKGVMGWGFKSEWPPAFTEMNQYIKEGKLKVKETLYEGFDKMRSAFYGLFVGENIGKAIIKA